MTFSGSLRMDWNPKTPSPWDWDNLVVLNGKVSETPKQLQPADCRVDRDKGIDNGSAYSSGGGGGSSSDLANGSSSKSSISASIDSSSKEGTRASEFNFKTVQKILSKNEELAHVEDAGTSELVASVGHGEPLIGLRLGKRTYFEDTCAGSTAKSSSFSVIPTSSSNSIKKPRATYQNMQNLRCQVEGCNVDLTGAKDYHRRHRVCESHSKCPKVIVSGLERRFCQQCSRFHELAEFDEKKRSCRRRLSDHNARRRKPQPDTISFSSARLSSSFYDGGQQMNLGLNRVPLVHTRPAADITWEDSCNFKLAQAKGSCLRSTRGEGIDGHLHLPGVELPSTISTLRCHDFDKLLSFKGATAEVLNQGLEASMITSNLDATPDIRRALSLLSTSSWGSPDQEPAFNHIMHANHTSAVQPMMHMVHQGLPHASSELLQAEHPSAETPAPSTFNNSIGQFQEFQLFKEPLESAFFYNNHMD